MNLPIMEGTTKDSYVPFMPFLLCLDSTQPNFSPRSQTVTTTYDESFLLALYDAATEALTASYEAFRIADEALDALCGKEGFDQAYESRAGKRNRWLKAKAFEKEITEVISLFTVSSDFSNLLSIDL